MSPQLSLAMVLLAAALCHGQEQKYCGPSLARILAVLCYDSVGEGLERKSEGSMFNEIFPPYYNDQEPQYGWAGSPHKSRAMYLSSPDRSLFFNECCDKPCTLKELLAYCEF